MSNLTFGDDFLSWVKGEGIELSRSHTENDFIYRANNLYITSINRVNSKIELIVNNINLIAESINISHMKYSGGGTIDELLNLKNNLIPNIQKLIHLKSSIEEAFFYIKRLDSISTTEFFKTNQFYQIANSAVLASLIDYGDSVSEQIFDTYPIDIKFQISDSGDFGVGGEYEVIIQQLLIEYGFNTAAYWFAVITVVVILARTDEQLTQRNKQMVKLKKAIELFYTKYSLKPESAYSIWEEKVFLVKGDFEKNLNQLTSILNETSETWKNVFISLTTSLKALNKEILIKRATLSNQYRVPSIDDAYLNEVILKTSEELSKIYANAILKADIINGTVVNNKSLVKIEDFSSLLSECKHAFNYVLNNELFAALHQRTESYLFEINKFTEQLDFFYSKLRTHKNKDIKLAFDNIGSVDRRKLLTNLDVVDSKIQPASLYKSLGEEYAPSVYLEINLRFNTDNDSEIKYENGWNQDNFSFSFIAGNKNDGGFHYDQRKADVEFGKFKKNINKRNLWMQDRNKKIKGVSTKWFELSKKSIAKQLGVVGNINSAMTTLLNQSNLQIAQTNNALGNFSQLPISKIRVNDAIAKLELEHSLPEAPQLYDISPDGPNLTSFDLRSRLTKVIPNDTFSNSILNGIYIERARMKRDHDKIQRRIEEAIASGAEDSILKDKDSMHEIFQRGLDRAKEAERFATEVFGDHSENLVVARRLLDESRALRFYGLGYTNDMPHIVHGVKMVEQRFKLIDNLFTQYEKESFQWATPHACTIFIKKVLRDAWGFDDLVNPKSEILEQIYIEHQLNEKPSILTANVFIRYMQLDKENFEFIGKADNQPDMDRTGELLNNGEAIILGRFSGNIDNLGSGGHVALGRSGPLATPSGNYTSYNSKYGKLKLIMISQFSANNPSSIRRYHKLSYGWGDKPENILIFRRKTKSAWD